MYLIAQSLPFLQQFIYTLQQLQLLSPWQDYNFISTYREDLHSCRYVVKHALHSNQEFYVSTRCIMSFSVDIWTKYVWIFHQKESHSPNFMQQSVLNRLVWLDFITIKYSKQYFRCFRLNNFVKTLCTVFISPFGSF